MSRRRRRAPASEPEPRPAPPATICAPIDAASGRGSTRTTTSASRSCSTSVVLLCSCSGGVFALALRTELLTPERTIMDAMTYNRMFTLHGITMVWLFLIPSIPNVFGNFVLPIHARRARSRVPAAQPRELLRLSSSAPSSSLGGMVAGGADTGWTFYTPYSDSSPTRVVPVVIGMFVVGISSIFTGINFIATDAHAARRGMTWSPHAAVRLGDLRHEHHHGARDAGARPVARARRPRPRLRASASSIRRSAATRCCSSTCSGSTRTRPSTS